MKIIHERAKCIGCGSCATLCHKYWKMTEYGKAHLIGSKIDSNETEELKIKEIGCNQEAADVCPVQCIRIEKSK